MISRTSKVFVSVVLALCAGSTYSADGTLPGYGGYRFGMSYEDVAKLRSDDKEISCNSKDNLQSRCIGRETEIYGIPAMVIAIFPTGNSVLKKVSVYPDVVKEGKCTDMISILVERLTSKHGQPDKGGIDEYRIVWDAKWYIAGGGVISAYAGCFSDDMGTMVISYEYGEAL